MRFTYCYNTRENERREGVLSAPSRDAAYAQLKARGIRPSRVDLAPGLFNRLQSVIGRRILIIAVLVVALVAALVALLNLNEEVKVRTQDDQAFEKLFDNMTRRQPIGDAAIIEKGERTAWADVFPDEGERFLAAFAVPGVPAAQRNTTEAEIKAALSRHIVPTDADGYEVRQIKAMVEGLKKELRAYLAAGGTIVEYGKALTERQDQEIAIYNRSKTEFDQLLKAGLPQADLISRWEAINAQLRCLGIRPLPYPEATAQ